MAINWAIIEARLQNPAVKALLQYRSQIEQLAQMAPSEAMQKALMDFASALDNSAFSEFYAALSLIYGKAIEVASGLDAINANFTKVNANPNLSLEPATSRAIAYITLFHAATAEGARRGLQAAALSSAALAKLQALGD